MIDKNTLITHLNDFKNTKKYNLGQLAEFICKNQITSDFFENHVELFNSYIKTSPRTIIKYSKEYDKFLHLSYTNEEIKIIKNIEEKRLIIFWILNSVKDNPDIENYRGAKLKFAIDVYLEQEKTVSDLIDYITNYCIIPYSDSVTTGIKLTPAEENILEYIHKGYSVPQIVAKEKCSKHTVENHKKNICRKIDALNKEEYKNKKTLAKLHILATDYFK